LAFYPVEQKERNPGRDLGGGNVEIERKQPNSTAISKSVSQTELLVEGAKKLQQTRVIAQALRDTMLIYLIDMAILQVSESFDRHLVFVAQESESGRLS
jgi:hypothetical protein